MLPSYWLKQSSGKPSFPELLWSQPENKQFAGKLAVIGGNLHGFAAPAESYTESLKAGVGLTRVLLPRAVKKLVNTLFPEVEYAPGNPSGSFSRQALHEWLDLSAWADATLLAGDLGRNSETAIVFEKFLTSYKGQLTITKDAVDYALAVPQALLNRPDTTLVLSVSQLRKFGMLAGSTIPITPGMDLLRLIEALHLLTERYPVILVTKFHDWLCVAAQGQVSTTKPGKALPIWRVRTAARTSVWWLQNPGKSFEAITTAMLSF